MSDDAKKRPAFQFYPADWRKDVELRSCSIAARGLWMDMLCIAHECDPYGHLTVNGKAMTPAQIASQAGIAAPLCAKLVDELLGNGVARKTPEGLLFSKRMVEDERLRNIRAEAGKLGGNPALLGKKVKQKDKQPVNHVVKQKPTPSSSSSSSSSNTPQAPEGVDDLFEAFWAVYPAKTGKAAARKAFENLSPDAALVARMVAAVQRQSAWPRWVKNEGEFIPNPATWINGRRWEDELPTVAANSFDDIFAGAR